jgi:flagellar motility protein MotE (MotC chaperone)
VGEGSPIYPDAVLVEGDEDRSWRIPLDALAWHDTTLRLRSPLAQVAPQALVEQERDGQEVYLARDVLDKQVIDVERKKAVRVNDICFGDDWQLLGIDNSTAGLLRRLAPSWMFGPRRRKVTVSLIPWQRIELIASQHAEAETGNVVPRAARTQSGHLAELHPADIAEIVHQLTPGQGARIIEGLDDETAADTMEEIDTERQSHILENIELDRAADILQEMGPDKAADLIAQLPEERAEQLLRLMNPEESEDVQDLLEYEEDTAGGLMTTDYIALNQTRTAAEALEAVRLNIREHDIRSSYVYCVADETQDECRILGEVSLWDLLTAEPGQALQEFMESDVVTVRSDTGSREVAEVMAKYNLLAVPVVGEEGVLEGIVTVDDAIEVLLPQEQRRKPRRMY